MEEINIVRSESDNGIDNQGYVSDKQQNNKKHNKKKSGTPILHFPQPPSSSPSR